MGLGFRVPGGSVRVKGVGWGWTQTRESVKRRGTARSLLIERARTVFRQAISEGSEGRSLSLSLFLSFFLAFFLSVVLSFYLSFILSLFLYLFLPFFLSLSLSISLFLSLRL